MLRGRAEPSARGLPDGSRRGLAEAHAVAFAAGLAVTGKRPIVAIYSTFLRAFDQSSTTYACRVYRVFAVDRGAGGRGRAHAPRRLRPFLPPIIPAYCVRRTRGRTSRIFHRVTSMAVVIRYPARPASACVWNGPSNRSKAVGGCGARAPTFFC